MNVLRKLHYLNLGDDLHVVDEHLLLPVGFLLHLLLQPDQQLLALLGLLLAHLQGTKQRRYFTLRPNVTVIILINLS